MGWFWDTKPNNNSDGSNGDAYSKLDPSLRDFLDKQTPLTSEENQTKPNLQAPLSSNTQPEQPYRAQFGFTESVPNVNQQNSASTQEDKPAVPPESLFQDGRYAHLWKNYRPQSEILAATQTDQDKLASIYDSLSNRKAAIGRAALENCIEEQMAEKFCYSHGSVKQRLTMCRKESREFHRCFSMQSRFLKALGYLSSAERTAEEEERIQMHADRLYHEMLEREKIMEEAQEAGMPKPAFQPLIQGEATTKALGEDSAWARARRKAQADNLPSTIAEFPVEKQKEIRERIKGLSEVERDVELQLIAGENRAIHEYAEQIDRQLQEEKQRREERREKGRETVGDSIKRMWGYGKR